jgi:two-component system OmpR family response regulator
VKNTSALFSQLSAKIDDRVKGLRAGGDDYRAKPYSFFRTAGALGVLARPRASSEETSTASPTSNSIGLHDV